MFLYYFEAVKRRLDFSIFVEVNVKHQLSRRIERDQKTRGYSKKDIMYQWYEHVIPCFEKYILPFKAQADFIYQNDTRAKEDFARLKTRLRMFL